MVQQTIHWFFSHCLPDFNTRQTICRQKSSK